MAEDALVRAHRALKFLKEEGEAFYGAWQRADPPDLALKACSHALHWAFTLNDILAKAEYPGKHLYAVATAGVPVVQGMMYARHHAAHHAAALLEIIHGVQLPVRLPFRLYEIVWARLDPLPGKFEALHPEKRAAFDAHLAGQAARFAIGEARGFFDRHLAMLGTKSG